jgi:heptosyltransferase-2
LTSAIRKILIVQTAFPGDVVLTLPLAEGLRKLFPEAAVDLVVTPDTAVLVEGNPFVNRVFVYDKRSKENGPIALVRWMTKLRREQYDLAVVPHRSLRSALLVWGAAIPIRIGFDRSSGFRLFNRVVRYPEQAHEVERNFHLLESLGWKGPALAPKLYPGEKERSDVDAFFDRNGIKKTEVLAAMAPGSVWDTKRWLPEKFGLVARQLFDRKKIRTVIIGGRSDKALAGRIMEQANDSAIDATGIFSLLGSAELIRRCRTILTNDSAPLHLAVGVGTPVVAVFGPTIPAFGFFPYGNGHAVIQKDLDCRPCGIHGGKRCPRGHFRCMGDIRAEEVTDILINVVSRET